MDGEVESLGRHVRPVPFILVSVSAAEALVRFRELPRRAVRRGYLPEIDVRRVQHPVLVRLDAQDESAAIHGHGHVARNVLARGPQDALGCHQRRPAPQVVLVRIVAVVVAEVVAERRVTRPGCHVSVGVEEVAPFQVPAGMEIALPLRAPHPCGIALQVTHLFLVRAFGQDDLLARPPDVAFEPGEGKHLIVEIAYPVPGVAVGVAGAQQGVARQAIVGQRLPPDTYGLFFLRPQEAGAFDAFDCLDALTAVERRIVPGVVAGVQLQHQAHLPQVVGAGHGPGRVSGAFYSRHQERREDREHCYDYHEFDNGERAADLSAWHTGLRNPPRRMPPPAKLHRRR